MKGYETALYSMVEKAKKYDELAKLQLSEFLHCSFCGQHQDQVNKLVAGPNVYICNECVSLCNEILDEGEEDMRCQYHGCKEQATHFATGHQGIEDNEAVFKMCEHHALEVDCNADKID